MWPANYKTEETTSKESNKYLTVASQGLRCRHLPIPGNGAIEDLTVDTETTASLVTATTMFPMAQKISTEAKATNIKQRKCSQQAIENTRYTDISDQQHYLHKTTVSEAAVKNIEIITTTTTTTANNLATISSTRYRQVRSKNVANDVGAIASAGTKVATSESATTTRTSTSNLTCTSTNDSSTSLPQFYCTTSKSHSNSNSNTNTNSSRYRSNGIHTMATPLYAWLLVLLCLIAYFGFGQAGFACLSNPCVFGVCIDGLNR